ncbi:MAG: hypothetical protein AAF587_10800 [Bacteroidota bacterium]
MKKLFFKKTGKEIKEAITHRCAGIESRLASRNKNLDEILKDKTKVRSYMLRTSEGRFREGYDTPAIVIKGQTPSEEIQEIRQLCMRINQMEQELNRLRLIQSHLSDREKFELELNELIQYGFELDR